MDDDIDMDIDLGDVAPPPEDISGYRDTIAEPTDQPAEKPVEDEAVPTKLHIRGLDELTTKEIQEYAAEHFPDSTPKVEWVDDTSANLTYSDAETSAKALKALTVTFNGAMPHDLQLRNAKPLSSKPTIELQIRLATVKDRKAPRAHERSRFYMMHPEHDPREQARGDPEYRKRKYPRRRRSIENNRFDVSMYDDDAKSVSSRSQTSDRANGSRNRRQRDRDRDRDRSASPSRTRDSYRRRDREAEPARRTENKGKELFPAGPKTVILANNANKELFPSRKSGGSALHRRNDSIDATYDTTSDVLSSSLSRKMSFSTSDKPTDGAINNQNSFPLRSDNLQSTNNTRKGNDSENGFSIRGSNKTTDTSNEDGKGFSIRGTAGFSIRGTANTNSSTEARVKELFPTKVNNKGKELFAGRTRKQAEEFY